MIKGFKEFITRGNAVDMAVGIVIGASFGLVIDSLVEGLINPIVGAILPGSVDNLALMTFEIGGAEIFWGAIVSALITFLLTAFAIYLLVVMPINKLNERRSRGEDDSEPTNEEKMVDLLEQIANRDN
ncbi:MAG: large conductance mechanosensitive channel protein MscL [Actinomycetia bacterium]|nr:large conductance mechanosensitive channel protein MscL [Actinomycetes bacterium]